MDHQTSLSAEHDHVAVDVSPALHLQALHHRIDADEGARPADSSAAHKVPKVISPPPPACECVFYDVPAVDDDGTAEEVLERVYSAPQFQEEVGLVWNAVVGPAHKLDVGHLPLHALVPLLHTHTHVDIGLLQRSRHV